MLCHNCEAMKNLTGIPGILGTLSVPNSVCTQQCLYPTLSWVQTMLGTNTFGYRQCWVQILLGTVFVPNICYISEFGTNMNGRTIGFHVPLIICSGEEHLCYVILTIYYSRKIATLFVRKQHTYVCLFCLIWIRGHRHIRKSGQAGVCV